MLSVPTLWIVFVVNFLAVGLVWTYVMRAYPKFEAARFWTAATLIAALGSATGLLRLVINPIVPLIVGGMLVIVATSFASMGVERFYGRPVSWRLHILIAVTSLFGLGYFAIIEPSTSMRIIVYSLAQSVPVVWTLQFVLPQDGRKNPGARLFGHMAILMVGVNVIRCIAALFGIGGAASMVNFNQLQAGLVLILVFLSMAWNFGFLLMAINRLREEVADLAMSDDLTGIANRRHLLQRLSNECAVAQRTGEPFTLLAIDLDGFKAINDSYGHGAGDACLQLFTRAAQSRLRPNDLLARSGGDEFCAVLPASTAREGAMIARHIIEECCTQFAPGTGASSRIAASIGVAQWNAHIGSYPERLIAAADQALYLAKNEGKGRYAVYEPAPPPSDDIILRRSA
jgi:diguanylate cyclase (GGDEF)-like protein